MLSPAGTYSPIPYCFLLQGQIAREMDILLNSDQFPFIASLVLAAFILLLLGLVVWLIVKMRKLRRMVEVMRSEVAYANPGPAPKDPKYQRRKNEYSRSPAEGNPSPTPNRHSLQRTSSRESVEYVPSRRGSLSGDEPARKGDVEMQELYENQVAIQIRGVINQTSTDELPRQQSRGELAFENEGFDDAVINEPVYMNRGELAVINNPESDLLTVPSRKL